MTAREQAEQLRQEAISTLLDEKAAIEEMLLTLGYQDEPAGKRRGRAPKPSNPAAPEAPAPIQESPSQYSYPDERQGH